MTVFMHVIHTVRPLRGDVFDQWVDFYANEAMPAMKRAGFDVLGAWKLGTGRLSQDLLLARFESLAAYEQANITLRGDQKMGKAIGSIFREGMEIEEHATFASGVPYNDDSYIEKALTAKPNKPRQYLLATLPLKLGNQPKAYEAIGEVVQMTNDGNYMNFVAGYESISGQRGTVKDVWVLPGGMHDLSYRPHSPGFADFEKKLRAVAPEESFTFMNPLPYSPLQ